MVQKNFYTFAKSMISQEQLLSETPQSLHGSQLPKPPLTCLFGDGFSTLGLATMSFTKSIHGPCSRVLMTTLSNITSCDKSKIFLKRIYFKSTLNYLRKKQRSLHPILMGWWEFIYDQNNFVFKLFLLNRLRFFICLHFD